MNPWKSLSKALPVAVLLLVAVPTGAWGQQKKPLDHDVYAFWNKIHEQAISDDGRWALWSLGPEDGDAELRVRGLSSDAFYRVPRGVEARFSPDGRFAVFLIKPPKEAVRQARLAKKKDDELPRDSLGILDLETGAVHKVAHVKSFKLPEDAGGYVAYHLEKPVAEADSADAPPTEKAGEDKQDEDEEKDRETGTPLVLRDLATGVEARFEAATDYLFSKDGRRLAYTAASEDSTADGAFAVTTASGAAAPLMTGPGVYTRLALDEAGTQAAFLSNRDDYGADQPAFTLYHTRLDAEAPPAALVQEGTPGVPEGWWVGEHGAVSFSEAGTRLFFGTAPRPAPEDTTEVLDEDKVVVDVWSWTDPYLMTMQLAQKEDEEKRTYRAVVLLGDGRVVQLADEAMPEVTVGREGDADVAVANTNVPYRQEVSWDWPRYYDVYLIDVNTGKRRRVLERVQDDAALSPDARYLAWWDRDALAWFAMDVAEGEPVNLTAGLPYPVHNERHDWPHAPNPYGRAGWTEGDGAFLVYDRHDVWAVDPAGAAPPRSVTEGRGRPEGLRFRYVDLDDEEEAIDPDAPLLLSAFHLDAKDAGFYRDRVAGTRPPERLVWMDRRFSNPTRAEDADRLLYTRESFYEFPDLWVAGLDFNDARRISHANPQQDDYRWGTVERVEWTSLDGTPLQGMLYKPEGFDPARQYPMMVYFYEKNAENLHRHWAPEPHRSIINFTFYVSRGYLVFVPDIPYKVGYPGESALQAVVPGVTSLIDKGFVDPDRIGVQGHSWGGYQVAYLVTRTDIFRAAEAGAPVSNMVSAYGGIRWETGLSRMFQYEQMQSRIGGSLWETPLRYIENSPIFWADRIETPLLILHNDHDGAVPWYQGIELFVALRRLGKPAWLINYNDEPHWPVKYQNKRDWTIRMQQFFDHYLRDAPAPVWLQKGIPAVQKGKTLGLEPAAEPASSE